MATGDFHPGFDLDGGEGVVGFDGKGLLGGELGTCVGVGGVEEAESLDVEFALTESEIIWAVGVGLDFVVAPSWSAIEELTTIT